MSSNQWPVLGLILLLLGLEAIRSQAVRNWFTGAYSGFNTALNNASNSGQQKK